MNKLRPADPPVLCGGGISAWKLQSNKKPSIRSQDGGLLWDNLHQADKNIESNEDVFIHYQVSQHLPPAGCFIDKFCKATGLCKRFRQTWEKSFLKEFEGTFTLKIRTKIHNKSAEKCTIGLDTRSTSVWSALSAGWRPYG